MSIKDCPRVPITDVLSFIVDNRGKTVPTAETGTPLIATNCILNERLYPVFENIRYVSDDVLQNWFRAHLKPHDILFVNKGTPGRCCLVPDPVTFCAAQDMIGLRCNAQKIYYRYLLMVLRSAEIQKTISNNHVGLVIPHFKKENLPQLMIPVPEMAEQKALGDLYFQLCEKIENNNAICSNLEAMAKLLYDYWFVQFDFPDENGKPYKSSGGKMVWNDELKREIPEGWEIKPLSEVFDITMGSSPSGESLNTDGNGIEFYQGSTDFGELYPSIRVYTTSPVRFAKAQDVLMSVRAPVGDMNIAMNDCCIGRGLAAIHSDSTIYAWCTMITFKPYFDIFNGNGTTFGALTSDDLKKQLVIAPKRNVLDDFYRRTDSLGLKLKELSLENQHLVSLRDFLLPMLMNGQVKVGKGGA